MKRILSFVIIIILCSGIQTKAQIRILFDATKAETAGNADWVIDAVNHNLAYNGTTGTPYVSTGNTKQSNPDSIPKTNPESGITANTPETYWVGALSYWGIDCVKKGYHVATLPAVTGQITYGNTANKQDLMNYNIFVVDEPNIKFTTAEADAIVNFVKNGGGLFLISDHITSDRNNDGWDSPGVWNDLMTNNTVQKNPFGFKIDSTNISGTFSNILNAPNDSLLHGPMGNVTQVKWSNGATMTLNPTANPTVKGVVFKTGTSGNTNVLCAYCRYGKGKVVAVTDSSPFDDGTGNPNTTLYDGYITDAAGNHQRLIMNATIWLATKSATVPLVFIDYTATSTNNKALLNWTVNQSGNDMEAFDIQYSENGETFSSCGKLNVTEHQGTEHYQYTDNNLLNYRSSGKIYYRIAAINKEGSIKYSSIISIALSNKMEMNIYPNPIKNSLTIHVAPFTQHAVVSILNTAGKTMLQHSMKDCNGSIELLVNNLADGQYYISIQKADGTVTSTSFIKQQ